MRHATCQQLSHEPRAAINAIVDVRRMHLIAKIKTHGPPKNKKQKPKTTTKNEISVVDETTRKSSKNKQKGKGKKGKAKTKAKPAKSVYNMRI